MYEQIELDTDWIGERAAFLQEGMKVTLQMHESRPVSIRFPPNVTLTIVEADPVVRGQTAASSYKPAKLENGLRVLVPPFIDVGEGSSSIRTRPPICGGRINMIRSALMKVMTDAAAQGGRGLTRDFGEVENLQVSVKGPEILSPPPTARPKKSFTRNWRGRVLAMVL